PYGHPLPQEPMPSASIDLLSLGYFILKCSTLSTVVPRPRRHVWHARWPLSSPNAAGQLGGFPGRRMHMLALALRWLSLGALLVWVLTLGLLPPASAADKDDTGRVHQIIVPEEDRFTPFTLTIHQGDSVEWINQDTDDHAVVSDDAFTTTDHT